MICLFAGRRDEARRGFEKTIADSTAASNITLQLRGTACITFLHRLSYAAEPTRQTAAAVSALAEVNAMSEYSAAALGNLAWVADLEGDLETTERLAQDTCKRWRNSPIVYPFWWTALFPLLHAIPEKKQGTGSTLDSEQDFGTETAGVSGRSYERN